MSVRGARSAGCRSRPQPLTLGFLLLPIAAIFVRTGPGALLDQLSNPVVQDAFVVTLKTSGVAQTLILLLGTPTAYLLATRRFRGRPLAVVLVELPLVLPPAVAGLGLFAAFGRMGLLGSTLRRVRRQHPVHADGRDPRRRLRGQPALHPPGDRGLRGRRPERRRGLADARRRAGADVLPDRPPARARWADRRPRALVRPRARRVRRDDHVRGQPPGHHADAAARDLRRVRRRLRRGAGDGRRARRRQHPSPGRLHLALSWRSSSTASRSLFGLSTSG